MGAAAGRASEWSQTREAAHPATSGKGSTARRRQMQGLPGTGGGRGHGGHRELPAGVRLCLVSWWSGCRDRTSSRPSSSTLKRAGFTTCKSALSQPDIENTNCTRLPTYKCLAHNHLPSPLHPLQPLEDPKAPGHASAYARAGVHAPCLYAGRPRPPPPHPQHQPPPVPSPLPTCQSGRPSLPLAPQASSWS